MLFYGGTKMMNPYLINEKAVISFSGGRSSAFMLYKILEAHDFKLPDYVTTIFCNTGKEMPQTLDFVEACSKNWSVNIVWLEYSGKNSFRVVDYKSASRKGEPFKQLIIDRKYLPNVIARFCTSELKVLTIERFMNQDFATFVGIRADEPRRVSKMRNKKNYCLPLADEKVTERQINEFWKKQPFDLAMPPAGVNTLSNCDLCFLKGTKIKQSIIEHDPKLADWWIEQENLLSSFFRKDQPSYLQLKTIASDQNQLFNFEDSSIECFCGD
jgi:hypothetical protein